MQIEGKRYRHLARGAKTARRMADAARVLFASLSSEQQSRLLYPLGSEERFNWDYRPRMRAGLPLREMDSCQRNLTYALMSCGLSLQGNLKALSIMALEKILGDLEGRGGRHSRDPELYYLTIFGNPSDASPWGWRMEGHHLSLNFLVAADGEIAPTPNFFGANPAQVLHGPLAGLRILAAEEDSARGVLASLDPTQCDMALIDVEAPADIMTRWEPRVNIGSPIGLPLSEMRKDQETLLMDLIMEYILRMPDDLADSRLNAIEKEGKRHIHFAWAGEREAGKPHYYRLHGPSFFVEYDNTQNNANHIHSVWRDIGNDWGEDLMKEHYGRSHAG